MEGLSLVCRLKRMTGGPQRMVPAPWVFSFLLVFFFTFVVVFPQSRCRGVWLPYFLPLLASLLPLCIVASNFGLCIGRFQSGISSFNCNTSALLLYLCSRFPSRLSFCPESPASSSTSSRLHDFTAYVRFGLPSTTVYRATAKLTPFTRTDRYELYASIARRHRAVPRTASDVDWGMPSPDSYRPLH